jgi:salicylate hydroxylase
MPFKIVVVGTGIAGLSAAIALSDKGHTVTVVEATSQLKAIGGIIAIQPNANRVLDKLGVYQEMLRICGVEPISFSIKRYKDAENLIHNEPEKFVGEFGYP